MSDLAKIAYDAYVKAAGGKSLATGDPLPAFENLPQEIRWAWDAASQAVARELADGAEDGR